MMQERTRQVLLLILLIAAVLRLWNIGTIPQWDYDEGTIMNISWNLLHGKFLLFNLKYPFVPHPPFFYMVTAGLLAIFGNDLVALRVLAALCSVATVFFLYKIGRELSNPNLGLVTAFLYAIYPNDIFFSRIGFANNMIALISVAAVYCFIRYRKENKTQWLYYASAITGIAIVTEFIAVALFVSIILLLLPRERKHIPVVSLISLAPVALFAVVMLTIMPDAFITDFSHQFVRLRDWEGANVNAASNSIGLLLLALFALAIYRMKDYLKALYGVSLWCFISLVHPGISMKGSRKIATDTLFMILLSLNVFIAAASLSPYSDDMFFNGLKDYFIIGFLGVFLIRKERFRDVVLIFFLTMLFLFVKVNRADHMVLLLYPYFCIGLAFLLHWIYQYANSLGGSKLASASVLLLLSYPFAFIAIHDVSAFVIGQGISSQNVKDTLAAADYLNRNTNVTDIVVTDDHTMRFLHARTADYVHCFIIDHKRFVYADPNLGPERFVFNSSYRNVKYFVLSKRNTAEFSRLGESNPDIMDVMDEVRKWPVHEVGTYSVYRNPGL